MRVKIGETWHDATKQPICLELSCKDRENIANMHPDCTMYAAFPDDTDMDKEEMLQWMARGRE